MTYCTNIHLLGVQHDETKAPAGFLQRAGGGVLLAFLFINQDDEFLIILLRAGVVALDGNTIPACVLCKTL